jgi:hypothetical protein
MMATALVNKAVTPKAALRALITNSDTRRLAPMTDTTVA